MIVREKPAAWEVFFVLRGSIIWRIFPLLAAVAGLSLIVVLLHRFGLMKIPAIAAMPLSIIGAALSIFAAFRNWASYDRWWEARKVTGLLVIEGRNLAREALAYIRCLQNDDLPRRMALRCIAMMMTTRDWLRSRPPTEDLSRYLTEEEREILKSCRSSAPVRLLYFFSADIASALNAQRIPFEMARTLEERVVAMTAAFSMLERTKATPMPFGYTLLIHRTGYLFCFLLPFGLADLSGYWTPLVATVISYAFFGLDAIADELEAPFADTPMTIPLDATSRALEINILEMLGEGALPAPMQPKNFILT